MRPLISIVMPVYNAAGYLETAIRGVVEQTTKDWELILVNDASTDGSGSICDAIAATDERIHVIHISSNAGLSMARNTGMDAAIGKYLMFMDSDDWIESNLIESVQERLKRENPPQWMAWGIVEEHYDSNGEIMENRIIRCEEGSYFGQEAVYRHALQLEEKTLLGYAWNKLYDLEMLREHEIVFEVTPLIEDILFNLQVLQHAKNLETVDITPYHYARRNEGSLTHRFLPDYYELSIRRIEEILRIYEQFGMAREALETMAPIYARYTLSALQRNCDPRAEMSLMDRRKFARATLHSALHEKMTSFLGKRNGLIGLIETILKVRNVSMAVLMGRAVYLVNTKMSGLFTRLSNPQRGEVRHEATDYRGAQL